MKLNITRKGRGRGDWTHLYNVQPESDDDTCAAHLLANGNEWVMVGTGPAEWTRYTLAEDAGMSTLAVLPVVALVAVWFHYGIVVRHPVALGAFVAVAAAFVVAGMIAVGSGYVTARGVRR